MANSERDLGHVKFYCTTNPKDGAPHGMRFDPGIFSDGAIKMMLGSQIDFASRENGSVKLTLFDSTDRPRSINIAELSLSKIYRREDLIDALFSQVRKEDVVKAVIIRNKPAHKKSAFEGFINSLPIDDL